MSDQELLALTISEIAPKIKAREVSPVEITRAALERITRLTPSVNSFITVLHDQALVRAKEQEQALVNDGYRGPLHGIPIGIKDNMATRGIRTTIGSRVFANHVPDQDAAVVERCRDAGAVVLGKENLHEFAMGVSSDNPHYGAVHNPWALDYVPGGSSGGSAANVASCMTFGSLGSDAGGSVRIPASVCGVVGIKPTYGLVSQRGLMSSALVNDHVGPLTRSVRDSALMLQAIAGYDPLDSTSVSVRVPDYPATIEDEIHGLKMGIPGNYYFDHLDPQVDKSVHQAITTLKELGIEAKEVSITSLEYASTLRIISAVENLAIHEKLIRRHREDYGSDVLYRMLPAQFVSAVDYARCLRVQRLIKDDFARVLSEVDFIVTPTTPVPAFPIDAETVTVGDIKYAVKGPGRGSAVLGRNTFISNHVGLPSITVPCGYTAEGLPIGLQFVGRAFNEDLLFRIAYRNEMTLPRRTYPPTHLT